MDQLNNGLNSLSNFTHDFKPIETERLIIRRMSKEDLPDLFLMLSNPEVVQQTAGLTLHTNQEQTADYLQKILQSYETSSPYDWTILGMVEKESNKLVGYCGIMDYRPHFLRAELGYALNQSFWGKGYATEAIKAVVVFCFTTMKLNRIEATAFPEHTASIRVLEKAGMRYEGLMRQRVLRDGKPRDRVMYGMIYTDFATSIPKD